jgi:hypothetical protein
MSPFAQQRVWDFHLSPEGIGSQADVFYAKFAAFRQSPAELSTLLGYAMAHELGHLLLGTNSHSPTGLMRADWRTKDLIDMSQGGLRFSEEQARAMKAKLSTFASRKESSLGRPSAGRSSHAGPDSLSAFPPKSRSMFSIGHSFVVSSTTS